MLIGFLTAALVMSLAVASHLYFSRGKQAPFPDFIYRERDDCAAALQEVTGTNAALEASFDLRWNADRRAIKRWQAATGKTLIWPDHADLCVWLLEQLDQR